MSEIDWAFVLPLLVLNGVTTLLAWNSRYHAGRSRRRQIALIWLLPVIGAVLALIAQAQRKPLAARVSVSRAETLHYGDGTTVWSSAVAYRYERDGYAGDGSSDAGGNATGSGDSGGSDGGCGGGDGGGCH